MNQMNQMDDGIQIDNVLRGQVGILRWEVVAVAAVCGLLWFVVLMLILNSFGWAFFSSVALALVISVLVAVLFVLVGGPLYTARPAVDIEPVSLRSMRFRNRGSKPAVVRVGVFRLHGEEAGGRRSSFVWKMRPETPDAIEEIVLGPGARSREVAAPDPLPPMQCVTPEHGLWARLRFYGVEISQRGRYPLYIVWLEPTHAALIMGHHSRSRAWRRAVIAFREYLEMLAEMEEYSESLRRREEYGDEDPDFVVTRLEPGDEDWEKLLEPDEYEEEQDDDGADDDNGNAGDGAESREQQE